MNKNWFTILNAKVTAKAYNIALTCKQNMTIFTISKLLVFLQPNLVW